MDGRGDVWKEIVAISKETDVPLIVDAAAELPPAENLFDLPKMGADLTLFSGGKGLKGPQASGLVLGRRDLIEACRLNSNPHASIGRPMKVGKEEIIGLVAAVELYVQRDHDAEHRKWENQVHFILDAVRGFPGVIAEQGTDRTGSIPNAIVRLDPSAAGINADDLVRHLREGVPGIEVNRIEDGIQINPAYPCGRRRADPRAATAGDFLRSVRSLQGDAVNKGKGGVFRLFSASPYLPIPPSRHLPCAGTRKRTWPA